jgi:hypothetical protein
MQAQYLGKDRPPAHGSRGFNRTEKHYSSKELAAIVWGIKHFGPYSYDRKFKIVSYHKPLTWIMNVSQDQHY